jgi:CRISPR-associated protein (TIGR03986 family)
MITVVTKKGSTQLPVRGLSSDLAEANPSDLEGMEVEYKMDKGLINKIWKKGTTWQGSERQQPSRAAPRQRSQSRYTKNFRQSGERRPPPFQTKEAFHNPYNFVPALPREHVNNDLGDHEPRGHHAYHNKHWSGWLDVELKTATPLLIIDAAQESINDDDHRSYPVRVDANGAPYLPPTSIKGMLRAAYEAVTNSRFGVFEKHEDRLAYRMEARQGIEMVPALVEKAPTGLQLRLLSNNITITDNGAPQNGLMYAAWLPRYQKYRRNDRYERDKHESQQALCYPDNSLPEHGDPVWVRCQQQTHRSGRFSFLIVTAIRRRTAGEATPSGYQAGIVCITGRNIMNKHDERVFLLSPNDPRLDLSRGLIEGWETLVKNYQSIHADDLEKRKKEKHLPQDYLGHEPGKTAWSRHVYTKEAAQLKAGDLCYARVANQVELLGLYPVIIPRELFDEAPTNLLHSSLHPAIDYSELSPAERVFGWIHRKGKGTWKGQLRIVPATCEQGEKAIEDFGKEGVPLAILGEAKPQQAYFYVAHNRQGDPLPDGKAKTIAYKKRTQGLRGRKVYPHHAHLAGLHDYWLQPRTDSTQKSIVHQGKKYYQEYRRQNMEEKGRTRDNQNSSVFGWVKPDTIFRFKIHISNLSSVELGALLWLLRLDENSYHRLGNSKPLGFGSVQLKIKEMELRKGEDWADFYQNLFEAEVPDFDAEEHIKAYKEAVAEAYGKPFEEVSFIKAFKVALRGFSDGLPVHYPRTTEKPEPKGESFKWFVENERQNGPHLALPSLDGERGLPLLSS